MDAELLRGILFGALGSLIILGARWYVARIKRRMEEQLRRSKKTVAHLEGLLAESRRDVDRLRRLLVARPYRGPSRETIARGLTAPPPEPWQNGLYRALREVRIGEWTLEPGAPVFTSEHHIVSGAPTVEPLDRDSRVDDDLRQALRRGELEMVADAERVELLGGSLQQAFRNADRAMARMSESMRQTLPRVFQDFDRNFAQLSRSMGQPDRVDAPDLDVLQRLWATPPSRGDPDAIVEALEKVNAPKPEPPPEPKRPSRYDVLVDDDEMV